MAKQLQLRKGTAAEHSTFTGANGEVTVDTTNKGGKGIGYMINQDGSLGDRIKFTASKVETI